MTSKCYNDMWFIALDTIYHILDIINNYHKWYNKQTCVAIFTVKNERILQIFSYYKEFGVVKSMLQINYICGN